VRARWLLLVGVATAVLVATVHSSKPANVLAVGLFAVVVTTGFGILLTLVRPRQGGGLTRIGHAVLLMAIGVALLAATLLAGAHREGHSVACTLGSGPCGDNGAVVVATVLMLFAAALLVLFALLAGLRRLFGRRRA
jgi:hypothetical protein